MMVCVSRRCAGGAVLLAWALIWGQPWVRADSREALTIVAFGDSTTAPREVEGKPLTVYADILQKELPSRGMKVNVVNAGTRGDTTADAAKRLTTDVLSHEPDVVIVQFGANDAMVDLWKSPPATQPRVAIGTYEKNLRTIVRTLSDRGAKVILMTPNQFRWTKGLKRRYGKPPYQPNDPDGFNVLLKTYAEIARRVADEQRGKVVLVDVYEAFGAYGQVAGQSVDDLLLDGIHPNAAGHRLVADGLINELVRMRAESRTTRPSGNQSHSCGPAPKDRCLPLQSWPNPASSWAACLRQERSA